MKTPWTARSAALWASSSRVKVTVRFLGHSKAVGNNGNSGGNGHAIGNGLRHESKSALRIGATTRVHPERALE